MGLFTYQNKNWVEPPKSGELNQRIRIAARIAEINENGYPEEREEEICETWARVLISGNATYEAAGADNAIQAMNFDIRYREGIECGMYVLFEGKRYKIVALNEYDHKKRFLGMKTAAAEVMSL